MFSGKKNLFERNLKIWALSTAILASGDSGKKMAYIVHFVTLCICHSWFPPVIWPLKIISMIKDYTKCYQIVSRNLNVKISHLPNHSPFFLPPYKLKSEYLINTEAVFIIYFLQEFLFTSCKNKFSIRRW